jgi:hypothetical protein
VDGEIARASALLRKMPRCLPLADIVAKVENRTTLKISPKSIFVPLRRYITLQRHGEGP